jgi:hypothetical protein
MSIGYGSKYSTPSGWHLSGMRQASTDIAQVLPHYALQSKDKPFKKKKKNLKTTILQFAKSNA